MKQTNLLLCLMIANFFFNMLRPFVISSVNFLKIKQQKGKRKRFIYNEMQVKKMHSLQSIFGIISTNIWSTFVCLHKSMYWQSEISVIKNWTEIAFAWLCGYHCLQSHKLKGSACIWCNLRSIKPLCHCFEPPCIHSMTAIIFTFICD